MGRTVILSASLSPQTTGRWIMRRLTIIISVLLLGGTSGYTQTLDGKKIELSVSGSYQSSSFEAGSSSGSSSGVVYLTPRIGFFLVRGLEFEPEASVVLGSGQSSYILNGNLAYNFPIRQKDLFFLLAGYGFSNAVPLFNGIPVGYGGNSSSFGVLNLGAGLKVRATEDVALRLEFRHQRFEGTQDGSLYIGGSSVAISYRVNTVAFGFSIFL
jgi:hypothetical protein